MAFYGVNDIKKLVTTEVIKFIMKNQDYVLNNTSYGTDLSYEACCESLVSKDVVACGLKRLTTYDENFYENKDKYALVYQVYGSKGYQTITTLWLIDYYKKRYTDDEEVYKKIIADREKRNNSRLKTNEPITITMLTYKEKSFDTYARKYYNRFGKQFKGHIINCKKTSSYSFTCKKWYNQYFLEFLHKNGKKETLFLH